MKKSIFVLILLLSGMFFSCEDFLDNPPLSNTTVEGYYKTADQAEIALTGVYNVINMDNARTYRRNLCIMLNGATDELIHDHRVTQLDMAPFGNASFSAQSNFLNFAWISFYAGINRANILLDNLDNISDFSGNRKIHVESEARVLRGFYYMILAMMHGGVPLYTTGDHDPYLGRMSIQEVYAQVIEDLDYGYRNLPHRASLAGRINKWTAGGFLSKVYTYLAAAKHFNTSSFGLELNSFDWVDYRTYYERARDVTKDIIDNSEYILIDNYAYLFRETTRSYQYQETLLAAEANADLGLRAVNHIVNLFIPAGSGSGNGGGNPMLRPLKEHIDRYDWNLDTRFRNNVTASIVNANGTETIEGARYYIPTPFSNYALATTSPGKYRMIDPATKDIGTSYYSGNMVILRFADIILLYAESLYFLGDEAGARAVLSDIRKRAVTDEERLDELNAAYYNEDFVEELLDERSRELCYENWRRIDLCRFNKYDEKIQSLGTESFYNQMVPMMQQNWRPEKIWFPIPQVQIDLNPNLIPNPGY